MRTASLPRRGRTAVAAVLLAASLAGCYVVPLQPPPSATVVVPAAAAPGPLTFSARLYPANELASGFGVVAAVVTNDLNGRGHFSTAINGESFSGEATRAAGSSREGTASGAGNRGSWIHCRYTMNAPALGSGTCRMSNGALFSMHLGS